MIFQKKNGGALTIFKVRSNSEFKKTFKRFPKISQLTKVNQFIPSRGSVIFFSINTKFIPWSFSV